MKPSYFLKNDTVGIITAGELKILMANLEGTSFVGFVRLHINRLCAALESEYKGFLEGVHHLQMAEAMVPVISKHIFLLLHKKEIAQRNLPIVINFSTITVSSKHSDAGMSFTIRIKLIHDGGLYSEELEKISLVPNTELFKIVEKPKLAVVK